MPNPLLEKLDKDFPLVQYTDWIDWDALNDGKDYLPPGFPRGREGEAIVARIAKYQRSATLRRVVEQLIDIGVLSSDRQHRAAVEALTAEILEMLEAKK